MWALCCDTKGCATVGLWKQLTTSILTVAFPANTAHSPNVGLMSANVADADMRVSKLYESLKSRLCGICKRLHLVDLVSRPTPIYK